ncbi:Uma2 family endonuclease [Nocardia carnea]|uniref:Uma2 family endonuclease n=1 Tax=Nocardia carnea TaxID=37328 RepID=A0ABW7TVX2_9NOCA|nr:Uma2 family endonuclease [Nocardia carnea]
MSAIFDWATSDNLQPEPVTVEIWRKLPEDYCRQVEVVNGNIVRAEAPRRAHQKAARRLADMIETGAREHTGRFGGCLDVDTDFDVLLWDFPRATIRRPDIALFDCAPDDMRPLPAGLAKLVVEVVSPGSEKVDTTEKKAEYAAAGIPWYWVVWIGDNRVIEIDVHVLDHGAGEYRLYRSIAPAAAALVEVPVRIELDWARLSDLVL